MKGVSTLATEIRHSDEIYAMICLKYTSVYQDICSP